MLAELNSYDWEEAFKYARSDVRGEPGCTSYLLPFTREDVEELIGMREGENDGPAWKCAGRLKDGRWFYLEAGCDYTGWD